jgi:hypothetical protein
VEEEEDDDSRVAQTHKGQPDRQHMREKITAAATNSLSVGDHIVKSGGT